MFLLPLLTCVFPSLTISFSFFFSFGLGRFGFAALAVSVGLIQNNIDFIQSIKFNASKCKVLSVTRKKSPVDFVYHLGPEILRRVHKEKDLGVILSNNLSLGTPIFNGL